jgi:dTDP-4-amino-4,6-dideoxygalactose transaminase
MISYGKQYIDNDDIKMVLKACKSDMLTQGTFVRKFENDLEKKLNAKYCISVNNGTAALYIAIKTLDLNPGSKVICSPVTFLSSVYINEMNSLIPTFCDIELETYNIDLNRVESLLKKDKKVKAMVIVDYAGHPCDWKSISFLKKKYNLRIINDNCHALGAKYFSDRGYAASYADMVTQSFHPVKGITTGEGGAILTNNKKYYEKLLLFRNHGIVKNKNLQNKQGLWFYDVKNYGFNFRLTDIQCALGISQLKKLNNFVKKRNIIANYYHSKITGNENIKLPVVKKGYYHSFHLYPVLINFSKLKITKKSFFKKMLQQGISLQTHYIPIYRQSFMKKYNFNKKNFKNAELFYSRQVSLPIFFDLSLKKLDYVIKNIKKLLR